MRSPVGTLRHDSEVLDRKITRFASADISGLDGDEDALGTVVTGIFAKAVLARAPVRNRQTTARGPNHGERGSQMSVPSFGG
jgi:hypothetical protein